MQAGDSALHLAVRHGHRAATEVLLERGCDVNAQNKVKTSNTRRIQNEIHNRFVLLLFWNLSGTTRVSRYQKGKTRKVKTNLDLLEQEIVSGNGIC